MNLQELLKKFKRDIRTSKDEAFAVEKFIKWVQEHEKENLN